MGRKDGWAIRFGGRRARMMGNREMGMPSLRPLRVVRGGLALLSPMEAERHRQTDGCRVGVGGARGGTKGVPAFAIKSR